MKIALVGNRDGRSVINWLGVIAVSGIVATISLASVSAFMLVTNWFSLPTLILVVALCVGSLIGFSIQRALQLPIEQLPPFK